MKYTDRERFIADMKARKKQFAISIILPCRKLPNGAEYDIIKGQLIRSSSSVASYYRAASRAISTKMMYSKMKIVEEEADESQYCLEVLDEIWPKEEQNRIDLSPHMKEAGELVSIFSSSVATLHKRISQSKLR